MLDLSQNTGQQGRPAIDKQVLSFRINKVEKTKSKKGNDMLVFTYEACSERAKSGNKDVAFAGNQCMEWLVLGGHEEAVRRAKESLVACLKCCKADPTKLDVDNPAALKATFVGKGVRREISTESEPLMEGDTVAIGVDGVPIVNNNYRLGTFIGPDEKYTIPAEAVAF